jgi:hypothetical protein
MLISVEEEEGGRVERVSRLGTALGRHGGDHRNQNGGKHRARTSACALAKVSPGSAAGKIDARRNPLEKDREMTTTPPATATAQQTLAGTMDAGRIVAMSFLVDLGRD